MNISAGERRRVRLKLWIVLMVALCLLFGCGQKNVKDLAVQIDEENKTAEKNRYIPLPSNKEQNRKNSNHAPEVVDYAEQYGYYLNEIYLHFNEMKDLFYQDDITSNNIQKAKQHVAEIESIMNTINKQTTPKEFAGLKAIHAPFINDLSSLEASLNDLDPNNEIDLQRARLYFENAVTSHKIMQLEYRVTTSELGIN